MAATDHRQSTHRNTGPACSSLLILTLIFFFGCSAANIGSLKQGREVAEAFETLQVFADHRYYYLNQENNPYAVAALKSPYTIRDIHWTEFDPHSDLLKKVVGLVEGFPLGYSYTYGAYLLDPHGNQIGYWYSSLRMTGITVDDANQTVSISTEMPWLWDDYWGYEQRIGGGRGSRDGGVGVRFGF